MILYIQVWMTVHLYGDWREFSALNELKNQLKGME